ncbi:MAG: cytochrome P450, partial [Coxiellaceae bacterium]|nr:cytochrome P450 [Coxiellaceae bacterium]
METVYTPLNVADLAKIIFGPRREKIEILTDLTHIGDVIYSKGKHKRIFVNDPSIIYQVLVKNVSNYSKEGTSFEKSKNVLGTGTLTDHGEAWAKSRKCVQPNFYHHHLAQCVPVINQFTDTMLEQWQAIADQRKPLNIVQEMSVLV